MIGCPLKLLYVWSTRSEDFTALEASPTVWEGGSGRHQPSTAISISCQDSRSPPDHKRIQCGRSVWTLGACNHNLLAAEGISGLVQRIPDSTSIAFLSYSAGGPCCALTTVFVQKDTCQHRDPTFPSPQGPHSQFLFYFGSPESSEMVAARISIIHFCVVPINLLSGAGGRCMCVFFCELHCKYKLFKEIVRCNQCTTF